MTHRAATRSSHYSPSKAAVLVTHSIHGKCAIADIASGETQQPSKNSNVPEPHAIEPSTDTSVEREATGTIGEPVETDRCFNPAFSCVETVESAGLTRRELEGIRRRLMAVSSLTSSFYSGDKDRREVHLLRVPLLPEKRPLYIPNGNPLPYHHWRQGQKKPRATAYDCLFVTFCACVCVFIMLRITARPGPVIIIFQCYR